MPTPSVVVVGSFVQDMFFETASFPRPGQSVIGKFRTAPGGKGFNQAVAAARAGADTGFIGALGRDEFGSAARAFLDQERVASRCVIKTSHASGTAVVVIDSTGQNQIVVALGANDALQPEEIPAEWLEGARVLVGQLEVSPPTTFDALSRARANRATTILNPAPMREDFDPAMLAQVDILVPNESEFAALVRSLPGLGGCSVREDDIAQLPAAKLQSLCRKLGPGLIVVTLGERGCFLSQPDRGLAIPALPGVRAIDTTGAGDAFVGALGAAYLEFDGDAERAVRFANAAGGLSVQRPGAAPSMPRRSDIDAALGPGP